MHRMPRHTPCRRKGIGMTKKNYREEHDWCSPSQLERRWRCPGSVHMEQKMRKPDKDMSSAAATRGTILHDLLKNLVEGNATFDDLHKGVVIQGYTLMATDVDHVAWCYGQVKDEIDSAQGRKAVFCEYQADLSELGISGGLEGNRVDVAIVMPGYYAVLPDYKMGAMWVTPPKWNWQFKAYAWGVWKAFGGTSVKSIKLQPYLGDEGEYMEYTFTVDELEQAGKDIAAIVAATKEKDAPLMRGNHCQYCTAKDVCPHFRGALLSIPQDEHVYTYLEGVEPTKARELYQNLQAATEWVGNALAACQAYGLANPDGIAGYIEGESSTKRKWVDEVLPKLVVLAKEHRINVADLQATAVLSPAQMEKLFPKGAKDALAECMVKPKGKAMLIEDPDYRAPQLAVTQEEAPDEDFLV